MRKEDERKRQIAFDDEREVVTINKAFRTLRPKTNKTISSLDEVEEVSTPKIVKVKSDRRLKRKSKSTSILYDSAMESDSAGDLSSLSTASTVEKGKSKGGMILFI